MIPTYIIHVSEFKDRFKYLNGLLPEANWVTDYDIDDIPREIYRKYYSQCEFDWSDRATHLGLINNYRRLDDCQVSRNLKHMQALESFYDSGEQLGLIIQDNVVLSKHFTSEVEYVEKHWPEYADIVFLTGPEDLLYANYFGKDFYFREDLEEPYCNSLVLNNVDAYMITRESARLLMSKLTPFSMDIEYEYSYWMDKCGFTSPTFVPYACEKRTYKTL